MGAAPCRGTSAQVGLPPEATTRCLGVGVPGLDPVMSAENHTMAASRLRAVSEMRRVPSLTMHDAAADPPAQAAATPAPAPRRHLHATDATLVNGICVDYTSEAHFVSAGATLTPGRRPTSSPSRRRSRRASWSGCTRTASIRSTSAARVSSSSPTARTTTTCARASGRSSSRRAVTSARVTRPGDLLVHTQQGGGCSGGHLPVVGQLRAERMLRTRRRRVRRRPGHRHVRGGPPVPLRLPAEHVGRGHH